MNATRGTVYLVGQSAETRAWLARALREAGFAVVEPAAGRLSTDAIDADRAGCVLLALGEAGAHAGLAMLDELTGSRVGTPVVMTSESCDVPTAVGAMRRGASDFLQLPVEPGTLCERLAEAVERDAQRIAEQAEARRIHGRLVRLTPRQRQLLDRVIAGMSNKQIAAQWGVSERTVANHRANLLARMRAVNTADLVRMAMEVRQHDLG